VIFLESEDDVNSGLSLIVEDDGRVSYAYLISPERQIIGDVWLYNRCSAPREPEWTDRTKAPFANPHDFVLDKQDFRLPSREADITIRWISDEQNKRSVEVFVHDVLIARLQAGQKPGWARAAAKDGPLAKILK
jgi:hypothetical protein